MSQRYILIGSTGFIGRSIQNNFKKKLIKFNSKNFNLNNLSKIKKHAKKFKNSTIIYAAGLKRTREDNFKNFYTNLNLFNNLFEFFFENTPKKIIFLSSAEVYGHYKGKKRIDENTKLMPATNYSLVKILQEKIIRFFSEKLGFDYLILRLPGVYGNDPENQNIISKMISAKNKSKFFKLNTSGNELRDYVYVNDIGKIITRLTIKNTKNSIVNISSGKSFKINEIKNFIEKNLNKKIYFKKVKQKNKRKYNLIYDNKKLKTFLPKFKFKYLNSFNFQKEFL